MDLNYKEHYHCIDCNLSCFRYNNGQECGGKHCMDLNYKEHYHCIDCNFSLVSGTTMGRSVVGNTAWISTTGSTITVSTVTFTSSSRRKRWSAIISGTENVRSLYNTASSGLAHLTTVRSGSVLVPTMDVRPTTIVFRYTVKPVLSGHSKRRPNGL